MTRRRRFSFFCIVLCFSTARTFSAEKLIGPDGAAWSLGRDGWLYTNGSAGYGNTLDFAIGRDGTVYKLRSDGDLSRVASGGALGECRWQADGQVRLTPDGAAWSLGRDGWLYTNGSAGYGNTLDFAIGRDGTVYKLRSDGDLSRVAPGGAWESVGGKPMAKFALTPDGAAWSLGRDGWLYTNGSTGYGNTLDFAIGRDGTVYKLRSDGDLSRVAPGGAWESVGGKPMAKFALTPDGAAWSLGRDGWLYTNGSAGYGNTLDFAIGRDGTVYKLRSDGDLSRVAPGGALGADGQPCRRHCRCRW